ncbi:tetratricopeptide repeat protein [Enhygromyxa salina]|nr:tetratricopeptide repeat protein [Enhygromyxa salina]
MHAWPRGLIPATLRANSRGVELLYRAPGERWFRVEASLDPRRPSALNVRGIPGPDPAALERVTKAVEQRLLRSPSARAWLTRAREFVEALADMRAFGGPGSARAASPEHASPEHAIDQLLTLAAQLRRRELDGPEAIAALERTLAEVESATPLGAELGIALALAGGAFELALTRWGRHAEALAARDDRGALACAGIMRGYLGQIPEAQVSARALAGLGRDASDARHAGELLELLGLPALAVEQLRLAATDPGDDASAFDAHRRLASVAAAARELDLVRTAAAAMREHARRPEQLLATALMQREGGEFLAAEATLEQLLRDRPEEREGALLLASSRLWRCDHEGAAALAAALLERAPDDAEALRTLGAAAYLASRSELALDLLNRALHHNPGDDEALLWRAELLDQLGRYEAARADVRAVTLGDRAVWQLLRALIEEHATPTRRITHDTWFIVDTNIRQLLGDEAPADSKASHEVAVDAITRALAQLGGNRSARLTTPTADGSLRWLDDIESPRRRAEQLQLHACHRPVDEVLAEFEALAARNPTVPFFTTYAAELLMWRGDYERAFTMFEQVWYATRTRWGYVGAGAAAMFLGREQRALELWDEGKGYYSYLDAEATYCYRGELRRRGAQLDEALPDLELAVQARPRRLGAWVNLALLHHAAGREGPLREAVAQVEALCPAFAWEARREAGLEAGQQLRAEPDLLGRYMSTLLERMRGNRSSVMYSIVDRELSLRVLPVGLAQTWRDFGRRGLALFEDELLFELAVQRGMGPRDSRPTLRPR